SYHNDVWKYNPLTSQWAWVSGDSSANSSGNYGAYCQAGTGYHPGARWENRSGAVDTCGNVWMYGGNCISGCSDLWVYNLYQNDWTMITGSPNTNASAVNGSLGIPNINNHPGAIMGAISWFDYSGTMWLMGGFSGGYLNQLWRYVPNPACLTSTVCVNIITTSEDNYSNVLQKDIYPNPVSDYITVEVSGTPNEKKNLIIYNTLGKEERRIEFYSQKYTMDISDLQKGIYFLRLTGKNESISRRFVKE
ncbi:MAG: T9SS type A sorting domain-containing protein, partial [Bacteroidia bacterium]|nr:T9SS type A sorting domain-containing protein [Bacteroidia bacterium]